MGGMVLQTNMTEILARIEEQNKLQKTEAGIASASSSRMVSAVKSINLSQQIKDIKLLDLPQSIKDFKFWPSSSANVSFDSSLLTTFNSNADIYQPINNGESFNFDHYQSQQPDSSAPKAEKSKSKRHKNKYF